MGSPLRFFLVAALACTWRGLAQQLSQQSEAEVAEEVAREIAGEAAASLTLATSSGTANETGLLSDSPVKQVSLAYKGSYSQSHGLHGNDYVPIEGMAGPSGSMAATEGMMMKSALPPPERKPLEGIRSLIAGSLLLGLVVFTMSACALAGDGPSNKPHVLAARKVIAGLDFVEDLTKRHLPHLGLESAVLALFIGAGPSLILSGLVGLVASLRLRKTGGGPTLWIRGLFLLVVAGLTLGFLSYVPETDDNDVREFTVVSARSISQGASIVGSLLLMFGLGQWLVHRTRNRGFAKPIASLLPDVKDSS